jgi:hypothetical protein
MLVRQKLQKISKSYNKDLFPDNLSKKSIWVLKMERRSTKGFGSVDCRYVVIWIQQHNTANSVHINNEELSPNNIRKFELKFEIEPKGGQKVMHDWELQYKKGYMANLVNWTLVTQMYGQALENKHD